MKIQMRGPQDQWTDALKQHAGRRLQFALSRFSQSISAVAIDIRGTVPNPACRITVRLLPSGTVRCEAEQSDLYTAISLLSDHAGRAVQRTLDRERVFRPRLR